MVKIWLLYMIRPASWCMSSGQHSASYAEIGETVDKLQDSEN